MSLPSCEPCSGFRGARFEAWQVVMAFHPIQKNPVILQFDLHSYGYDVEEEQSMDFHVP